MAYKNLVKSIPKYSKSEEKFNIASHEIAVYFSVAASALIIIKSVFTSVWSASLPCAVLLSFAATSLFFISCNYHNQKDAIKREKMRIIDHACVHVLVGAVFTPFFVKAIQLYSVKSAFYDLITMWCMLGVCVLLNIIGLERFKVTAYTLCFIASIRSMVKVAQLSFVFYEQCIKFLFTGSFFICLGVIMYFVGSKRKWLHSVFHVLVMLCCTSFYLALFLYII